MRTTASIVAPLFVPANRPDRFAKAVASGTDAVILDLEDAVPSTDREAACRALTTVFTSLPVIVRINAAATPWHHDDLRLNDLPIAAIILPKAEHFEDLKAVAKIAPVIALIETARGIAGVRDIACSGLVVRLTFRSADYAADISCDQALEPLQQVDPTRASIPCRWLAAANLRYHD